MAQYHAFGYLYFAVGKIVPESSSAVLVYDNPRLTRTPYARDLSTLAGYDWNLVLDRLMIDNFN